VLRVFAFRLPFGSVNKKMLRKGGDKEFPLLIKPNPASGVGGVGVGWGGVWFGVEERFKSVTSKVRGKARGKREPSESAGSRG